MLKTNEQSTNFVDLNKGLVALTVSPVTRLCARAIDMFIFSFFCAFITVIFFPSYINVVGSLDEESIIFYLSVMVIWIFVESLLISKLGTTLGKWLFGMRIKSVRGDQLKYMQALKRSVAVWFNGIGMGVFTLITMVVSFNYLVNEGATSWDKDGNLILVQDEIRLYRRVLQVIFCFFIIIAIAWNFRQVIIDKIKETPIMSHYLIK